jgi:aminopeptidase YwaD
VFRPLWTSIANQVSGQAAAQAVADLARFHRIQASPGFRRAAEWVCEQLGRAGLEGRLATFPADRSTLFWGARSFQEWNAREATLHLVEPHDQARKLADFRGLPLHLVARSLPFDGEAELLVLGDGEDEAEYDALDVRDKLVLARGDLRRVHDLAVRRGGAAGLVYDGMTTVEPVRPTGSLPDAVQYSSFWWQGQEPRGFGFALTPREGERLRCLGREHTLRVHAHVDTRLYDGALEVVEAIIPGTTADEIVLVAHLCHPRPSANDNASGAAALLEVAGALATLIARRELNPPRRGIRFLWLPEITGSFAYLSRHEECIPHMVAGLNLDMVGQDQDQCGSSLLFERPPDAVHDFATVLLSRLRDDCLAEARGLGGISEYALFRYADVPFSGGSDHYVFSDPSVGVPMPMLTQWPDRYYHTSADTPDRVDPIALSRAGCLAATYAYWLAQAGSNEARWLVRELSARFRQQIIATAQAAVTRADEHDRCGADDLRHVVEYRIARHGEALGRLRRLAAVEVSGCQTDDAAFAQAEWRRAATLLPHCACAPPPALEQADIVPHRLFRGPAQPTDLVAAQPPPTRDRWWDLQKRVRTASRTLPVLAEYWLDGRRSVAELATLVRHETGREETALLLEHFSFLAELGLVDVR